MKYLMGQVCEEIGVVQIKFWKIPTELQTMESNRARKRCE